MTSLTEYTVTFRTDAESAVHEITAASPQAALTEARAIAGSRERLAELCFDPYAEPSPTNEINVEAPDGEQTAQWLSSDLTMRLAAHDLLSALEKALTALNTVPRFPVPRLGVDSYAIAAECARAIVKAKGNPKSDDRGEGDAS